MKSARHQKLIELINNYDIDTQEELTRRLREAGFPVTQATVSRDIKDLRIIKTQSESGGYRYFYPQGGGTDATAKFSALLSDSAISVQSAGNIAAVKCHTGMAQAVCTALDSAGMEDVVATLAGDDTIFILCQDDSRAAATAQKLNRLIGR